jgi:ketosteroid isomerase-like protein
MSQVNVEIVRRGIEYRGHTGWLEWEDRFDSLWEDVAVEPEEYIDAGEDKVVTVLRMKAQGRGGISLEWRDGVVSTLRDGKIIRTDYYGSPAEALEAVGLRE